jgi:hypothetical protein
MRPHSSRCDRRQADSDGGAGCGCMGGNGGDGDERDGGEGGVAERMDVGVSQCGCERGSCLLLLFCFCSGGSRLTEWRLLSGG